MAGSAPSPSAGVAAASAASGAARLASRLVLAKGVHGCPDQSVPYRNQLASCDSPASAVVSTPPPPPGGSEPTATARAGTSHLLGCREAPPPLDGTT